MRFFLRRGRAGVVHDAVQEGGGTMVLMMTKCGVQVRWDLPHGKWVRAKRLPNHPDSLITCKRCRG